MSLKLLDSIVKLEEKKDGRKVVELLNMILNLSDKASQLCGYEQLMDYYFLDAILLVTSVDTFKSKKNSLASR